jgi:hypothetical protein
MKAAPGARTRLCRFDTRGGEPVARGATGGRTSTARLGQPRKAPWGVGRRRPLAGTLLPLRGVSTGNQSPARTKNVLNGSAPGLVVDPCRPALRSGPGDYGVWPWLPAGVVPGSCVTTPTGPACLQEAGRGGSRLCVTVRRTESNPSQSQTTWYADVYHTHSCLYRPHGQDPGDPEGRNTGALPPLRATRESRVLTRRAAARARRGVSDSGLGCSCHASYLVHDHAAFSEIARCESAPHP